MLEVRTSAAAAILGLVMIAASPAALGAPAQRTFVKSTGVDTLPGPIPNSCGVTSPCRSFAAAMLQTVSGGEVIVVDSAGYGAVTISQSVSIIAPPGVYAGITASSGDGITVDGAGIVVVLQGLTINGLGTGGRGIYFSQGAELHVRNCAISGMHYAIWAEASGGAVYIVATEVRDSWGDETFGPGLGMLLTAPLKTAILGRVSIENTGDEGLVVSNGAVASVTDSRIVGASYEGIRHVAGGALSVDRTLVADNGFGPSSSPSGVAVFHGGSPTFFDMIRSTSTRNAGEGVRLGGGGSDTVFATITDSVLSGNSTYGLLTYTPGGGGSAVALANGNAVARNGLGGLKGDVGTAVHTRSNNSGEQVTPTSGTVAAVLGF